MRNYTVLKGSSPSSRKLRQPDISRDSQRDNRRPAGAGRRPDHLRRPIAIHFGPYDVRPHDRDIGRGFVLAGFDS